MQASGSATATGRSLITWRVVAFVVVLLGVLAVAAVVVSRGGPAWAVALDGNDVVVKEGSTIKERTQLQVNQLPQPVRDELAQGKRVNDQADAKRYIDGITRRAVEEGTIVLGAGLVVTTTSAPAPGSPASAPSATTATSTAVPVGP